MMYISIFFMFIHCYANKLLYNYLQHATQASYYLVIDFEFYGSSVFHLKIR